MTVLWIVSFSLLGMYMAFMLAWTAGYGRSAAAEAPAAELPGISIVIPLRNESANLDRLLPDLCRQDYPGERLEVILVDDHSEDGTFELLRGRLKDRENFRVRRLGQGRSGKKDALHEGILSASHPLILNTDADCRLPARWCREIASRLAEEHTRMVIGPVMMEPARGFLGSLESLEMFSLSLVTGGSAGLGHPILCNGANLAYYREDYLDFVGQHTRLSESGDDLFLMHWLKRSGKGDIVYPAGPDSVVRISPVLKAGPFLRQRLRWASKTTLIADLSFLAPALVVYGLNFLIFSLLVALLGLHLRDPSGVPGLMRLPLFLLLGKFLTDLAALAPVLKTFGKRGLLWYLLPGEIVYFVYVSLVGFLSQFIRVSWKGRKI